MTSLRVVARSGGWRWLALVPIAFLGVFFVWPLVEILRTGLAPGGDLTLSPFGTVLGDDFYLGRLWFTLWQALVSTLLTLLLGLPSAYVFARYDFPGKTVLRALTTVPFVMPTIVVAFGFIALIGPSGLINDLLQSVFGFDEPPLRIMNTITVILLAHVFYNYTIGMRTVSALWANVDPRTEEAARVLGASPLQVFLRVTLPQIAPAIAASALLVFMFTFTSFGVVLILGGPEFATLEVTIYNLTARLFRLPLAAALSIVQLVFTFAFMLLYARLQERSAVPISFQPQGAARSRLSRRGKALAGLNFLIVGVLLLGPMLALVERSFRATEGYTLDHYRRLESGLDQNVLFVPLSESLGNSLQFAATTVAIAVPLGTIVAFWLARSRGRWRNVVDALFMLPLGVSAVTLGFGILITLDTPPLDLRASWLILVIAHVLVAYPFVVRSVLAVARSIDPRLREAAAVLGASPLRAFRFVDLPIAARAILVGATFAFAVSMGEFGASLLLTRPENSTLPIAIFRSLGQPGAERLGAALALSTILMAVSAIGFILIERARYRDIGEF